MDLNVKFKTVRLSKNVFENRLEQPIDGDITMPEYCPDIKKVLKCSSAPRLISARCSGDVVLIEANVQVRIIYIDDKNEMCCFEQTFPFSKSIFCFICDKLL